MGEGLLGRPVAESHSFGSFDDQVVRLFTQIRGVARDRKIDIAYRQLGRDRQGNGGDVSRRHFAVDRDGERVGTVSVCCIGRKRDVAAYRRGVDEGPGIVFGFVRQRGIQIERDALRAFGQGHWGRRIGSVERNGSDDFCREIDDQTCDRFAPDVAACKGLRFAVRGICDGSAARATVEFRAFGRTVRTGEARRRSADRRPEYPISLRNGPSVLPGSGKIPACR